MRTRVSEWGHNIPEAVIERRYLNGIRNLFQIYLDIVDEALIFDNSEGSSILIAEKILGEEIIIHEQERLNNLKKYYDN